MTCRNGFPAISAVACLARWFVPRRTTDLAEKFQFARRPGAIIDAAGLLRGTAATADAGGTHLCHTAHPVGFGDQHCSGVHVVT